MKVIVCLDKKDGMLFNHRRQSRDRVVISDVLLNYSENGLYVSEYSLSLFNASDKVHLVTNTLTNTEDTAAWRFVETAEVSDFVAEISELVVYRWDKVYPATESFRVNWEDFDCVSMQEIQGYSHETICKEVYRRKGSK